MKPIKQGERSKLARRLSKKIKEVLAVYNMSQTDLAHDIGVHHTTFSGWARGTNCPMTRDIYDKVTSYLDDLLSAGKMHAAVAGNDQPDLFDPVRLNPNEITGITAAAPTNVEEHLAQPAREDVERYTVHVQPSALDTQVGGDHYKTSKIQPIEYIEANDLTFLEGSIVKRVTRHNKPTGKGAEDMQKVIHEARLILEMRYGINEAQ